MKTKHILLLVGLIAIAATFSCQKSRYCRCITTEVTPNDTIIINIDRSMKCKRLLRSGHERLNNGVVEQETHNYTCEKIDKDSLSTINNLPIQE